MERIVGFDYHLRLSHLDFIAQEASTTKRRELYQKLDQFLQTDIKSPASRGKVKTMLMRVWRPIQEERQKLQEEALRLLPLLTEKERVAAHWGMTLLAYTFFRDLTSELGACFKLQDEAASAQLHRKMRRLYGDTRRVDVATSAVLASLKSWGVIKTIKPYFYTREEKFILTNQALKLWLTEVIIRASDYQALPLPLAPKASYVFPFQFTLNTNEFDTNRLTIYNQSLDLQMVCLPRR